MATAAQLERVRIVLVSTRNPLNIGAAARAMSNFGFRHLRVVNPYEPAFREARSAVGASSVLAEAEQYKSVADAVADCTLVVGTTAVRHRQLHHPLRRLEDGARLIRKRMGASRVALLFGSEKFGLSNEDLSHCHWLMRVPTREENISMNLGQAVAVCLYEIVRDAKSSSAAGETSGRHGRGSRANHAEAARRAACQRLSGNAARGGRGGKNSPASSPVEFACARRGDLAGDYAADTVEDEIRTRIEEREKRTELIFLQSR